MSVYQVVLPRGGHTTLDGKNSMIVIAGNETDAKSAAMAYSDADAAPWDQATVTEILEDASFAGLIIRIECPADDDNDMEEDFSLDYVVPAGASADTVDEIGDLLVAALNATAELAGVTYTAMTDLVTIVEGNNWGLSDITAKVYKIGNDGLTEYEVTSMALTVSAVGGDASSDRTITLTPLSTGYNTTVVAGYRTANID